MSLGEILLIVFAAVLVMPRKRSDTGDDRATGPAVVGNEDGAHHISAILFQSLNDVGFTVPAGGVCYWNGEAMHGVDYQDLPETPEEGASTTKTLAANAAHLAALLRQDNYRPS